MYNIRRLSIWHMHPIYKVISIAEFIMIPSNIAEKHNYK
jgi:hypothetical protein